MFTGIVEETGTIHATETTPDGRRLWIETSFPNLSQGQSVSVSGVCLTVEDVTDDLFEVFISEETVERTYLGMLEAGTTVNLERAMPADGRFDGHIVQGHVDGTAEVTTIEQVGEDWRFAFSVPPNLASYVVEKGSITVDGISLTVASLDADSFEVAIVPETYEMTSLDAKDVGDGVHLEVDVVAKYVESLVGGYVSDAQGH